MEIQARPPISRPSPVSPQSRVEDQRTAAELAARRAQEQGAVEQRRQQELASLRRAQAEQADKGRQVDRYA